MDERDIRATLMRNQKPLNPPKRRGLINLPTWTDEPEQPEEGGQVFVGDEIIGICDEVQRIITEAQQSGDPWAGVNALGPVKDYMDQIKGYVAGSVPIPAPGPAPAPSLTWFTAPKHHDGSVALDVYVRGENAKGRIRRLPWSGRLDKVAFMGPLAEILGTSLNTVLFTPMHPISIGPHIYRQFWVTHVDADIKIGPYTQGERAWTVSDSGIEFERVGIPAEAAHEHWAASTRFGALSPNGDISPLPLLEAVCEYENSGLELVDRIPGPQDYLARRARRGLFQ